MEIDSVFKHDSQPENNMPMYDLKDSAILELINSMSEERVTELSEHIAPLIRRDGKLHKIKMPNLFNTSFTWIEETEELVDANQLTLLGAIRTFHTCGYHMFVKPTVAEVLAQIPEEFLDDVDFFESLVDDPVVKMHLNGEFYGHSLVTLLYKHT